MKCMFMTRPSRSDREACFCDGCMAWKVQRDKEMLTVQYREGLDGIRHPVKEAPSIQPPPAAPFTHSEEVGRILMRFREALKTPDRLWPVLLHYGPALNDMALRLDMVEAENAALRLAVDMVATKQENDELRKRVRELETAAKES